MKVLLFFLSFLLLIFTGVAETQPIFPEPLSPRIANYHIRVALDTDRKVLSGSETVVWYNKTAQPATELRFHLYMNAFRNLKSSFLQKRNLRHKRLGSFDPEKLGGIDLQRITLNGGEALLDRVEFIQPDDRNPHDSTVIRIPLPEPVPPGEKITLNIDFQTRLPRIIARTGYVHDFFLLGQWFPKLGVFENGEWNCHQFHPNSEFFADFGVYDVELTLPLEFVVGATGILQREETGDSLKTLHFHAEDVHDFALTAWQKFRRETRKLNGTSVSLLYAPEHSGQVERYFTAISNALIFLGEWLGPYPYPNLTLVDPPHYASAAAGMEYPCFIVCGTVWGLPQQERLLPEDVTIHEFAHQYFYGLLASNEFEEAWLDEGFTSFATMKVLNKMFGLHNSMSTLLGIRVGSMDEHKSAYLRNPAQDYIVKPAWEFQTGGYGRFSYSKPVLLLQTLENYLGDSTMNKIMETYLQRWKFRHPVTQSFVDVVNEIAPQNMNWFLEPALYGTDILDYQVSKATVRKIRANEADATDSLTAEYQSRVEVRRNGTFVFPVEIAFRFSGGDTLIEQWDGKAPYRVFTFRRPDKLISAQVDPQNKIWLDVNWSNNSFTLQENKLAFWRHWVKLLQFYQNSLIGL